MSRTQPTGPSSGKGPLEIPRRELLRVGGLGLLGLGLSDFMRLEALGAENEGGGPGWGQAENVILVFLQGGPSHLDLWDPKSNAPQDVQSQFKTIASKVAGMEVTELLPRIAQATDKFTFIRSMSYTPNGLFNHTAAIYQMLTGYTADRVSPSGQLEPPNSKDFPNVGANVARLRPPTKAMLPFVSMPRPLQESNVIGKGGHAGFLGRAHDPYTVYPSGDDYDNSKMDRIKIGDLGMRPELSVRRLQRRARMRDIVNQSLPELEKAVERYDLDEYTSKAVNLVVSGRAREAFDLDQENDALRDRYGRTTFGQSCLLARRLVEAGTRFVQVNWPKVANSDRHSWDVHKGLPQRMRDDAAPMLDPAIATLFEDLEERGLLDSTLVVVTGEFGRSPRKGLSTSGNDNTKDGRDHWPYCFTSIIGGAGIKKGEVYGESDETGSAPIENPVHPRELLATIYHALGIPSRTLVYNHLNQPRELVDGDPVLGLFA